MDLITDIIETANKCGDPPDDTWLQNLYGGYFFPYYRLMYNLTNKFKPTLCVELGVNKGCGLASFARGNASTIVVGVDPLRLPEIDTILQTCPNTRFVQLSSTDITTVDYIKSLGQKIDILHFDTEHNYGQVINEFMAYKDLLNENAILLFDDSHAAEDDVKRAVTALPLSWYRDFDELHPICGYMIGIK